MLDVHVSHADRQVTITLATLPAGCQAVTLALPGGLTLSHQLAEAPAPLRLAETISRFLDFLEINEDRKANTLKGYRNRLGQFQAWLEHAGRPPTDPATWLAYYADLKRRGLSPYTLKGHFHILTRFSRWLFERGHLPCYPFADVRTPRLPQDAPPRAIRLEHINLMLRAAQTPREQAILMFFRDTGCRAGEALGLAWGDLDLAGRRATVMGKRDKARPIFFKPSTARALGRYRAGLSREQTAAAAPVWWGRQGPLNYDGLYKVFKRLAEHAGLDEETFGPHAWRHAFGRDTTIRGIPTAQLQDLMGHSSIETTKIYARFDTAQLQQAHDKYSPVDGDLTLEEDGLK